MKNDFLRRLEKIEKRATDSEPVHIFISHGEAVLGWAFDDEHGQKVNIMRQPCEDDNVLQQRTIEAAKALSGCKPPLPIFWCAI